MHPKPSTPMPDLSRVVLVLPAFNEEHGITSLLSKCLLLPSIQDKLSVLVVDDGSCDNTAAAAESWGDRLRVEVLRHPVNQGLGRTIRDGLYRAVEQSSDQDIIVTMDADDTQPIEIVGSLISAIGAGADIAIASRFRAGARVVGLSPARRLCSWCASHLMIALFPARGLRDYTCGYRAYRRSILHRAIQTYQDDFVNQAGFQCMADIILKLRALNPRPVFAEVPFVLRYDHKVGASKMKVLKTSISTLELLMKRKLGRFD